MKAYVCVYRQPTRNDDWQKTWDEASGVPGLKKYLRRYKQRFQKNNQMEGRFYDWGDDPSFFAAEEFLGDVRKASWGVCRPNVRCELEEGDFVVFFCAQQQRRDKDVWKYYYIGVGTVGEVIDRKQIWTKEKYKQYREFYNLLTDSKGKHNELIHSYHEDKIKNKEGEVIELDWERKSRKPYIIFDGSGDKTHFNLVSPLLVATYESRKEVEEGIVLEKWRRENSYAKKINRLIPRRVGRKKLRTSDQGYDHAPMNLATIIIGKEKARLRREHQVKQIRGRLKVIADKSQRRRLMQLRKDLIEISQEIVVQ